MMVAVIKYKYLTVYQTLFLRLLSAFRCPQPPIRSIVAKACSKSENYHCLYNGLTHLYQQYCVRAERFPSGSYVLFEGSLNAKRCPNNRYQPNPYKSSEFSKCIYTKSGCHGEGQIIHSNGTTEVDRKCRCDYRQGYDFIFAPKNRCFCIPSEEDCSCYIKDCSDRTLQLTPDYKCKGTADVISCPIIPDNSGITDVYYQKVNGVNSKDLYDVDIQVINYDKGYRTATVLCLVIAIIIITGMFIGFSAMYLKTDGKDLRREIRNILKNKCIVLPSFYKILEEHLQNNSTLLLKGRVGTGKTILALRLAALYMQKNYRCIGLRRDDLSKVIDVNSDRYTLIILNNIMDHSTKQLDTENYRQNLERLLERLTFCTDFKLIVTAVTFPDDLLAILVNKRENEQQLLFDLDKEDTLNRLDKENMLMSYLALHSKVVVDIKEDIDCMFDISDGTISRSTVDEILEIITPFGFPLTCSLFCGNRDHFGMGVSFFTQPPLSMLHDIERRKKEGTSNIHSAYQYCVMVYILLDKNNEIDPNNVNDSEIKEIFINTYGYGIQIVQTYTKAAITSLTGEYLRLSRTEKLTFLNMGIYQAVLISYGKINPVAVAKKCEINVIMAVFRPCNYRPVDGESVLILEKDIDEFISIFVSRLSQETFKGIKESATVGKFVTKHTVIGKDMILMQQVIQNISKTKPTNPQHFPMFAAFFSHLLQLPDNYFLLSLRVNTLSLCWLYVCMKCKTAKHKMELFVSALEETDTNLEFLLLAIDNAMNALIHYFVIWNSRNEETILSTLLLKKSTETKMALHFVNSAEVSKALYYSAYLGRSKMFSILADFNSRTKTSVAEKFKLIFNYTDIAIVKAAEAGYKRKGTHLQPNDKILKMDPYLTSPHVKFGTAEEFEEILTKLDKS